MVMPLLAGGMAGCSGDPYVDSEEHTGPVDEAEFAEMLVEATCEARSPCCAEHGRPYHESRCRSNFTAILRETAVGPSAVYNPTAAGTCIDQVRRLFFCDATEAAFPACSRVYSGTQPLGGACATSTDCAPDPAGGVTSCLLDTCSLASRGEYGDPCHVTCRDLTVDDRCQTLDPAPPSLPSYHRVYCFSADGLFCSATSQRCELLGSVGSRCTDPYGCYPGSRCDLGTSTCVTEVPIGSDCAPENGPFCDQTSFCGESGSCVAKQAIGETCARDAECRFFCDAEAGTCTEDETFLQTYCGD